MTKIILVGPASPLRGGISDFNEALAKSLVEKGFLVEDKKTTWLRTVDGKVTEKAPQICFPAMILIIKTLLIGSKVISIVII